MKVILQRIHANPWFAKTFEWGKLLTITGLSQILVQAVGFVGGILVIRLLPTNEYALYILANTMVGTMTVLADGGISTGVIAKGGEVWRDREKLGRVVSTGLDLGRKFGLASLFVAIPAMLLLLSTHHASWQTSALIVAVTIPSFFTALSGSLLQVAPKLQQDIIPLQKNQVTFNLLRLFLLALTLVFLPFGFIAMLVSSVSQLFANIGLRRISISYADWKQRADAAIRKQIMSFVKRMLPGSIYYCLSGQITIWLISIFGSTSAVAQIGALGRLAMVLNFFTILLNMLVVPRFARLVARRKLLLEWYLKIQMYLTLFCVMVIAFAYIFSDQVLWILGDNYSGLGYELLLSIAGSCLNVAVGINYTLNS
ncbi:MAG TPA: polysaccharide biosynthesis protein, partial [Chryseosolibacter sp.]|nr:polysaccharide biosynthesis protein [Chryseosolibacter sp.]